ncbi:MAG: hypothetical protein L3J57_16010 [Desulfuromusa sp.]|nr:hypothetical protein [Desulfuromusa sp.]
MNKKCIYRLVAILIALAFAGTFMFCDFGLGIPPLTKFFIIFFGGIIGLQCIPAALLFIGVIKGIFIKNPQLIKVVR